MNKFSIPNPTDIRSNIVDAALPVRACGKFTLLTGATGQVGQYLIRDLTARGQNVAVLVRGNKKASARQRIDAIMKRLEREAGCSVNRPVCLEGDISDQTLRLSKDNRSWVRKHCDRLIHNAAILKFSNKGRSNEPWITNLDGTQNVLRFTANAGIQELHHVSTAYVSGLSDTTFYETDLEVGQKFRNDYERSKFEAEKLVRDCDAFLSKTIYRPSVIVGDSQTGFTASYHGLYLYLRLMATLIPKQKPDKNGIRSTPINLPMAGDEPRNLVPIDWVSRVMTEIICDPAAHGQTYHLVPETGMTARQLIDYCYEYFNSTGAKFCSAQSTDSNQNEFAKNYLENIKVYSSYDTSDPVFDCRNVKQFCSQFPCPRIDKAMIFRFLDFGIADKWGKRKPVISTDKDDQCSEVKALSASS